MAISVDTIYQRVLALANKEQRGYVTPQEFNLLANHAQMSIFESYFYSKNRSTLVEADKGDDSESSISRLLETKLRPFTSITGLTNGGQGYWTYPAAYQVCLVYGPSGFECKKVSASELLRAATSVRHASPEPMYCDSTSPLGDIRVWKNGATVSANNTVTCEAIVKPTVVTWGYVVVNNKALYNANTSVNFQLHDSEEDTLVNSILESAGIVLNKPGLVQVASQVGTKEEGKQKA